MMMFFVFFFFPFLSAQLLKHVRHETVQVPFPPSLSQVPFLWTSHFFLLLDCYGCGHVPLTQRWCVSQLSPTSFPCFKSNEHLRLHNRYLVFEKADWNLKEVVDMNLEEKQIKHLFYQLMYGLKVSTLFSLRWITCEVLDCLFPWPAGSICINPTLHTGISSPVTFWLQRRGTLRYFFGSYWFLGSEKAQGNNNNNRSRISDLPVWWSLARVASLQLQVTW